MEVELSCELRCCYCNTWFRSPLQLGYPQAFFDLSKETTTTNCPVCGNRTILRKDDMRFLRRNNDGSIAIIEGRYIVC